MCTGVCCEGIANGEEAMGALCHVVSSMYRLAHFHLVISDASVRDGGALLIRTLAEVPVLVVWCAGLLVVTWVVYWVLCARERVGCRGERDVDMCVFCTRNVKRCGSLGWTWGIMSAVEWERP